jgi:hypothetical protein
MTTFATSATSTGSPLLRPTLTIALAATFCVGCYFNPSAPLRYYNAPKVQLAQAPAYVPQAPRARLPKPRRALVMPLWTSFVTNPVGGLYDHSAGGIVPLQATFFHPDVALPIWEASARRLRSYGVPAFKDYGDVGTATLQADLMRARAAAASTRRRGDKTAPPSDVLVLRARLLTLAHEQDRNPKSKIARYEAVQASLDVDLLAPSGKLLWRKRLSVYAKKAINDRTDLLGALGAAIADAMLREGALPRLLSAEVLRPIKPRQPTGPGRPKTTPARPVKPRPTAAPARNIAQRRSLAAPRVAASPRPKRAKLAAMPVDDASQLLDTLGDRR